MLVEYPIKMCSDFKLLDTVALQNKLITNNALVSSQNNRYSITVEDGLYVLQLCGLMDNILPTMSLKKLFIKIPDYVVSSNLGIDINQFINDLPQFELYEAVLRLDISEELNQGASSKQQPILAKWSPLGLISNDDCAVASLTNTGALNVFVRTVNEVELEEYRSVVNVAQLCIDFFKCSWNDCNKCSSSTQLAELKRRAEEATPTAFAWSNVIASEGQRFCLLFVGHINGGITAWRFDVREPNVVSESGISIIKYYKTSLRKITELHWKQSGKNGLLIVGDLEGRVMTVAATNISPTNLDLSTEMWLWNEVDHITVDNLKVLVYNEMILVLIVKGSFLLICLIDDCGELVDVHNFHAGNFQITGIEHFDSNIFLVLTYTGVLKELKVTCENKKLQIEWRPLYIDFKWSSYRTHGLIVSPNKVFVAILISISKLKDIRRSKDPIKLLIFMNMGRDPLAVLMKNTTDSLMTYWDCLEILRLDGLVERKLPCDGLPAGLDYDRLSLIQLKTCLWLAKSSEMMYDKMYTIEDYNILRYDEFRYIVKIKLVVDHMQRLLELIADGVELSEFHMQSLDILNMYLKEIIVNDTIPHLGLGKNTIDEFYNVISTANELEYPPAPRCLWCRESIIALTCIPPHVDTRCNISFMPISSLPYYKCPFCMSVVHSNLIDVYKTMMCPYCDVPLDFVSVLVDSNDKESTTDQPTKVAKDNDYSCCATDCSKETIDVAEIEDHAFTSIEAEGKPVNLIWVSSSDEDDILEQGKDDDLVEVTLETSNTLTSRKAKRKIT